MSDLSYAYPRCSIRTQIVKYINLKKFKWYFINGIRSFSIILYNTYLQANILRECCKIIGLTTTLNQLVDFRPEVMAGTSVSTLSKVGSTSSVLETSFNYVWENLSDFVTFFGGGEMVSNFF